MNRILWIDLIKVVAAFAVVLLHSAAPILYEFGKIDALHWQYGNIYDSAVRMCVPLFFMVSGALLLNQKEEPLKVFLTKRLHKVIIPLIAWSLIYILIKKIFGNQDLNVIQHMFEGLVVKQYFHLWFLYTIIGLYLFVPFLKIIIHNSSKEIHVYFVVLWIVAVSIIPLLNKFAELDITIPNHMPMMAGYVGYFVLGFLLSQMQLSKKILYIFIVLALISTLFTVVGTDYLTHKQNKFDGWFYGYLSISTLIQSISYFIILKYLGKSSWWENCKLQSAAYIVSSASLGIYLIHPIILEVLKRIGMHALNGNNTLYIVPLVALVTFFISFIIVIIMQKIPVVKKIVP